MFEFFKKIDRHSDLMGGMAQRLGVDLGEEVSERSIKAQDYRNALLRCTHCDGVEACVEWQEDNERADVAPPYCRNRDLFSQLAE
ncbi:DUF6455 family protein [Actibacterium sp. MT2.3-13A]|uniref:DUF6455 family protein n=1 Tax=Actibacterium sp. MT2.3-13A TaxID=2828332 RepID=UPI001BA73DC0|nr:DUF6455 family protein [Actibacterium sp. MT2.3-13A]